MRDGTKEIILTIIGATFFTWLVFFTYGLGIIFLCVLGVLSLLYFSGALTDVKNDIKDFLSVKK